ncbi:MAG: hypothetical protein ABW170_13320 [Candidatus Thiodiazotropha sp. L084R]
MKKRKLLILTMIAMLIVGGSYAAYPFLASMNPSMKANAEIPSVSIKEMKPGSYKISAHSRSVEYFQGYKSVVMLVKRLDGRIDAWSLLARNGEVGLPDYHWWQVYIDCKNFGPAVIDGVIDETKPITCHDDLEKKYGISNNRWKWSIDGRSLTKYLNDMERIEGSVKGDHYVLYPNR